MVIEAMYSEWNLSHITIPNLVSQLSQGMIIMSEHSYKHMLRTKLTITQKLYTLSYSET